ncbi:PD-(D/E)XK nuclease family protein [Kineococcus glutinatus]|uniref:PD-(D/E)XK nuclease superfamily protein n=1 Tax=Kineococcus glutinatus TaxID=1070872 RepID=A0ABP9H3Y2_9ACTN
MTVPIARILPLDSENRWSDLLAVLIEADPGCVAALLGLEGNRTSLRVRREVSTEGKDRIDLVLELESLPRSVIEVKVLSGLGRQQLSRYRTALPEAEHYLLVFPERLQIDIAAQEGWRAITWERLLTAFSRSSDAWVAETAQAWAQHLASSLPRVGADTRWNDLHVGEDFVLAMRARMSWVFGQLAPRNRYSTTW